MTEKMKVTRKQSSAIEHLTRNYTNAEVLEEHFSELCVDCESRLTVRAMDTDEIVHALYIGYEIKPEYKVEEKTMNYDRLRPAIIMCVDCKGLGKADGSLYVTEQCNVCKGTGRVERVKRND